MLTTLVTSLVSILPISLIFHNKTCKLLNSWVLIRLDKFWNSQDMKFDYKQNLTELHNRLMIR